ASLVVVVAVILLQMRYIKAKDLGYDPKNIMVVSFPDDNRFQAFKNELIRQPGVLGAADGLLPALGSQGHRVDGSRISWEGKGEGAKVPMDFIFVDEDYSKTYGMRMADGRFFSKDLPSDKKNFVLNEAAVRAMNLQDPVGKAFAMGNRKGSIIGVLKDFHLGTLRSKIGPAVFVYSSFSQLSIRLDPRKTRETIGRVETVWRSFIKDKPFEYDFLEDRLDVMYKADHAAGRLISVFGILSLVISCLGLFGLTSFVAEQRTKEIGIRKVLGATIPDIVRFMSREFAALVGLAVIVAVPAAYYASSRWLGSFAYRIGLAWWIFAGSGAAVALITLMTVAWRSLRAAIANPVESLRYE
ncbi:MAG: FtsX-like permease family protein, partial [Acidobacteriota bacterium]